MSRYTFNPKLDPSRDRNRRILIGAIVIGALVVLAVALLIFGITQLRGGSGGNTAAEPTPFVPGVTILAPQSRAPDPQTPQAQAALPAPDGGGQPAQPAQPGANPAPVTTMDPRGAITGIPDFTCPNPHVAPTTFGYGIQSNWPVGDIGQFNSIMAEQLKLDWTKAQVRWSDFENTGKGQYDNNRWQLLDAFTADANKKGLNILFGVLDAPAWSRPKNANPADANLLGPPDNFDDARAFVEKVLARYKGCVQAIEVWNEMNLDREWTVASRQINPADYVKFLGAIVPMIRQIDPAVIVLMGALSPVGASKSGQYMDDFVYMDQFVAANGLAQVDCIGVHLNGFNLPPDKAFDSGYNNPAAKFRGPFDNPDHSWSFKTTLEGYHQKTNKPACVTEFGWASMENLLHKDGKPVTGAPKGFDFALDNTEKQQADWIVQGFQIMKASGYVKFGIVFNLDYIQKVGGEPDQENVAPYSITRRNGSPRPAFDAIKAMPR